MADDPSAVDGRSQVDDVIVGPGTAIERFDAFMERCLYGPGGFYATTGTAGRKGGDFITSPEVGPLFGAVLAEALDRWWDQLGRPKPFRIFDVGCGPGVLLKAVALARPDRPWELVGVDRVDSPGAQLTELPDDLSGAVVVANELLDNLPFRIIENGDAADGGQQEVFVAEGDDGIVQEVLLSTEADQTVETVGRVPLLKAASRWVSSVLARGPAVLCLFDYGAPSTAELADRGGWLRTYRDHQRGTDPLSDPGSRDITTDIAWDQLPTPDHLERQRDQLRAWGIDDLVEQGRAHWKANAHAPDLTAIRMRSRISEAEALLDPNGLGSWWVATWQNSDKQTGLG